MGYEHAQFVDGHCETTFWCDTCKKIIYTSKQGIIIKNSISVPINIPMDKYGNNNFCCINCLIEYKKVK